VKAHCVRKGYAVRTVAELTSVAKYRWVALGTALAVVAAFGIAMRKR